MPRITLPDGSVREFDQAVSARAVAESIGEGLARAALGCKVNGELHDLSYVISEDVELALVTERTRDGELDEDGLYLLRHSCAHVMAEAIQQVKPGAMLVYGPPVESGFYYDIAFPDDQKLSSDDFAEIQSLMKKIIKAKKKFTRYDLSIAEGMEKVKGEGSKYKIDNAEQAIAAGSDSLSFYATGEPGVDWEDLCRGPHVPNTGKIGAFKVMSLASSYWHGDAESDQLTRVYGIAFGKKKDLAAHLEMLEEAKKRDHRLIGKQMGLFHIDEAVGSGLILWKPAGAMIRHELESFLYDVRTEKGFVWINTPHVGKLGLYRTSGHFPYYADSQFPPLVDPEELSRVLKEKGSACGCAEISNALQDASEGYLLKPMNCPHHIKVFDSDPHSYRDLPVRLAEFGTVYRWEQSGECHGMTRVRGFTQDDSHIFCTEDQLLEEMMIDVEMAREVLSEFGLDCRVRVGLRDPDSSKYVGESAVWDKAEAACIEAAKSMGVPYELEEGEAAFYGPKIDFVVKDGIGREWQLGTVQVDYNLPERFDLSYVGADNEKHRPVMIHCAPFGSMERFIGALIEHFAGNFPLWVAPEQLRILPISEKFIDYAESVAEALQAAAPAGKAFRIRVDNASERVQAKIRIASDLKVQYMLIVGGRDAEANTVSVRHRVEGDLASVPVDEFVAMFAEEVSSHGRSTILEKLHEPAAV